MVQVELTDPENKEEEEEESVTYMMNFKRKSTLRRENKLNQLKVKTLLKKPKSQKNHKASLLMSTSAIRVSK